MQYRYSRGQGTGQGSLLPRHAWGSGGGPHGGGRAASPEPGGLASANEPPKERAASGTTPQDEVILQLETELAELRNACQWKDQRIAELSRTDTPAARLKRDIRLLSSELHMTRKQLSDSVGELQELQQLLARGDPNASRSEGASGIIAVGAGRDVLNSPAAAGAAGSGSSDRQLRERISDVQEENRQLRDTVLQLKAQLASRPNGLNSGGADGLDGAHHARQPSGASTQRASEPPQQAGNNAHPNAAFGAAAGPRYFAGQPGAMPLGAQAGSVGTPPGAAAAAGPMTSSAGDEPLRQVVYSSAITENTTTLGPTHLQGVGTVDGVTAVAKVLLQRIHQVGNAHRLGGMPPPQPPHGAPPLAGGQFPVAVARHPGM